MKEGKRVVVAILPILGEATTSIEPANGALDNPPLRFEDKAFRVVATPDYLGHEVGHDMGDAVSENRPGIGAVRERFCHVSRRLQRVVQPETLDYAICMMPIAMRARWRKCRRRRVARTYWL